MESNKIGVTSEILCGLLRCALVDHSDFNSIFALVKDKCINWENVIDLSFDQGVAAIAADGLQRVLDYAPDLNCGIDKPEFESIKYEWFGAPMVCECDYESYVSSVKSLASLYSACGVRMFLMKGYGLSFNYPIPSHRPIGDIDVYLYGKGELADAVVSKKTGISIKQNRDKHSQFFFMNTLVENHATMLGVTVHPCLRALNAALVSEAEHAEEIKTGSNIWLPSPMFNALFLPYHCGNHFVRGEATVRQLCDWACFVLKYGRDVAWHKVRPLAEKSGYFPFYCCLNGIVQDHLGVPSSCLPQWPRDVNVEAHVLTEILGSRGSADNLFQKVLRYFSSRWKYRMVFNDSMIVSAFRLAGSYFRLHDESSASIWAR